jgi:hypothetical protein
MAKPNNKRHKALVKQLQLILKSYIMLLIFIIPEDIREAF